MAVPASGTLSLRGLANEKIDDNYSSGGTPTSISLANLATGTGYDATNTSSASYPDSSTPHSMSEWYSYDHDASSLTSFESTQKYNFPSQACADTTFGYTYYHDGSGTYPVINNYVYTDAAGTTALAPGRYGIRYTNTAMTINSGGKVTLITICK